jgi:uncharacterized protein YjbI with pentapeptide repeats
MVLGVLSDKFAVSPSNLATSATCQYKNERYDFTCDELARDAGSKFCIFHDINYLKGDNYDKHKEEVAKRFEEKLSEYSCKHMPLFFIGYCLPDISFRHKQLNEPLNFNEATFYGVADFNSTTFSNKADFNRAKFSEYVNFVEATFSNRANFGEAKFFNKADFRRSIFSNRANFRRTTFSNEVDFNSTTFSNEVDFSRSIFLSEAYFSGEFRGSTYFNYTIFEEPTKITFDISNMSKISFSHSDITRIRFSDKVTWGGNDGYTIIEEEMLENFLKYFISFD